jgi:hypothetical protein
MAACFFTANISITSSFFYKNYSMIYLVTLALFSSCQLPVAPARMKLAKCMGLSKIPNS